MTSAGTRLRRQEWWDARIPVYGRLVAPLSERYHGKPATYDYYGCRCDLCSRAKSDVTRRRRQQTPLPQQRAKTSRPPAAPVSQAPPTQKPTSLPKSHDPEPEPAAPAATLGGDTVPAFTPGARDEITTVDQLRSILEAYYRPQWSSPVEGSDELERRAANGHLIKVNAEGTVVFVGECEQSSAVPESLRQCVQPKRRKRGGSGSRNPTDYAEVIERLEKLGCAVDHTARHIKVTLPDGQRRTLPKTASDWRSVRNTVAQFKADGLDLRRDP